MIELTDGTEIDFTPDFLQERGVRKEVKFESEEGHRFRYLIIHRKSRKEGDDSIETVTKWQYYDREHGQGGWKTIVNEEVIEKLSALLGEEGSLGDLELEKYWNTRYWERKVSDT